jgi:tetratricopeptide (TPR) repeat protein
MGFLPSSWRHDWLLGFLLVALTLIAYQPVWHAGFFWDDDTFLTNNPVIKSAAGLYRLWFTASTPDYFPMTSSMLWLEWRMWANNPLGYHLVNVLLHGFSAVLLWRVLLRLNVPGALLAAAIFALHPVNVESVAWITERKNTLCMFFYAGTLLSWLKFEDSGRRRWYGLALGAFALALLSKTAVAPLPLVLLGMAWWRRGRVGWKDVERVVPFFVIAAALSLMTVWFQNYQAIGQDVIRTDSFWSRLAGAGWAVWFYLYKAVLPLNLAFVYPRWQIDARSVLSYIPLVLLAAVFVLCWRYRRGWGKGLFFGLAYFVVMLLPVLGFLNIYFMIFSLVADHWEYFAIIGPIVLAAAVIRKPVLAAALLLALGALTWKQCGMYTNAETLWLNTIRLNPDCWMAHNNLGLYLLDSEGRVDEAISHFQQALQIKPDNADIHNNLGTALLQKRRVDEAIIQYQQALQINPALALTHINLGFGLFQKGKVDEAITQYQEALELNPGLAAAHYNLGTALMQKGKADEAILQYQQALQIKPDYAEVYNNLGNALLQKGRVDDAILHFQKALQIRPDSATSHFNLGNALLKKGSLDDAITEYQKALQIKPNNAETHVNLGTALLQKGKVDEAILHFQKTLQIQPGLAAAHYNLGNALLKKGRVDEGIAHYQKALEIRPDDANAYYKLGNALSQKGTVDEAITQYQKALKIKADYAEAQNNLAWLLATCPEASLRNGNKAVELASQANALTGGENPAMLRTLAAAFAEAGRFSEAVETAQRALPLAGTQSNATLAGQLQSEMKLYQAGSPFHSPAQTNIKK